MCVLCRFYEERHVGERRQREHLIKNNAGGWGEARAGAEDGSTEDHCTFECEEEARA